MTFSQGDAARPARQNGLSRGWRRGQIHWRWNRLSGEVDPRNLDHPWIHAALEGKNEAWIAAGYGQTGCDPTWFVELDLDGTRAGQVLSWVAYHWRCWRAGWQS